ncbi:MAG: hydroxymethylglutaryl-CoA lyase [Proteobacteria bacterium]|jgi:hydroxymethylglutaryl-CoA lyase|nr:hydroxymethylglutaryl-CoA lyase [Pseudomonadota bacterium]
MIKNITIKEMSVRDGLQNEKTIISTDLKIELIEHLIEAGVSYIEATSFVSPKAVPQMADAAQVSTRLPQVSDVTYSALVPNEKGFEAMLQTKAYSEIAVFTAASETFNQKNINTSIAGSFERFEPVMKRAKEENIRVRGYVSTAFVCPYEGKIQPVQVIPVIQRLFDMGCYEVSIGDTIGKATPKDVDALFQLIDQKKWISNVAGHFHDTYGNAVENVLECLKWGVSTFDSSAGGIGGCPYAPGAKGNVSTESLVMKFDQMGLHTGIDLAKLSKASQTIARLISPKS